MGDPERQAETSAVAAHYESAAAKFRSTSAADRRSGASAGVRMINNFVKACVLDAALRVVRKRNVNAVDLACGRGQDMAKWHYAAVANGCDIDSLLGLDIIDPKPALELANRFLPLSRVMILQKSATDTEALKHVPDASVHVVSCQLALHYFCRNKSDLSSFFANVARILHPEGVVAVSFTDGRAVVRRCRNERTGDGTVDLKNDVFSISISSKYLDYRIPSPWGCEYIFSMEDSIDACEEYLCHEGAVHAVAAEHGLSPIWSRSFDAAFCEFMKNSHFRGVAEMMRCREQDFDSSKDVSSLYRQVVFSKTQAMASAWLDSISSGPDLSTFSTSAKRSRTSQTPYEV